MNYYIVIPAHNEEALIASTLDSILIQTLLPKKVVIVNDNSIDQTEKIIDSYCEKSNLFSKLNLSSNTEHLPGSKVINAFNKGLSIVDNDFEFVVKLDADLIIPSDYFETIAKTFSSNSKIGITGGFAYEENRKGEWELNHPMNTNHVRGAFKSYSKDCFFTIGGLKPAMGWDTLDELLAQYHGFEIITLSELKVKHLRPTGKAYNSKAKLLQGKAMYQMGYGFWLSFIASFKMAYKQKRPKTLMHNMKGFIEAYRQGGKLLVSKKEGEFIRSLRWKGITQKLRSNT